MKYKESEFCLHCGKSLKEENSTQSLEFNWHKKCVRKFFGLSSFPKLDISNEQLNNYVKKTVSKGFTVAGVQKKLSLHLSTEQENRLTLVDYPTGYILKPQTADFENLPEMEKLGMDLANIAGIKTVPNALLKLNGEYAYITKRIDRLFTNNKQDFFAMEDFCQLSSRLTEDKYKSSYEQCAKIIKKYSSIPGLDLTELFYRLVFCFLIGNSDMHLKNFSLIETEPKSRQFILSPAYDLLSVNVVMSSDTEETALTLNVKKNKLKKTDFINFAKYCDIPQKVAEKLITKLLSKKENMMQEIQKSYISETQKQDLIDLLENRIKKIL